MNDFCVASIATDTLLRSEHGLWRSSALTLTRDARDAATRILEQARCEAEQLRLHAADEARASARDAEQHALTRATTQLQLLEQRHTALLDGAQTMVIEMALALFDRALADTTPRERLEACYRRLMQEAPRSPGKPVLYLHPDDSDLAPPDPGWERKTDATLARGACRLEADGGEWRADFTAGAAALRAAFEHAALPAIDISCGDIPPH